jgi:hypothetical protein
MQQNKILFRETLVSKTLSMVSVMVGIGRVTKDRGQRLGEAQIQKEVKKSYRESSYAYKP